MTDLVNTRAEAVLRYNRDPRIKAARERYSEREWGNANEKLAWADARLTFLAVQREYGLLS